MTTTTAVAEMERRLIEVERTLGFNPTPNGQGERTLGQIWNSVGSSHVDIHAWGGSFDEDGLRCIRSTTDRLMETLSMHAIRAERRYGSTGKPAPVPAFYRYYPYVNLDWDEAVKLINLSFSVEAVPDLVQWEMSPNEAELALLLTCVRDVAKNALWNDVAHSRNYRQIYRINNLRAALERVLTTVEDSGALNRETQQQ